MLKIASTTLMMSAFLRLSAIHCPVLGGREGQGMECQGGDKRER